MSINDITGDPIKTKAANQAYRDNWELIYGDEVVSTELQPSGKALESGSTPDISTIPSFLKLQAS